MDEKENAVLETADQLQATIDELQKKQREAARREATLASEAVEMPLADITIRIDKNDVVVRNVTPAEVMLLVAMHHVNAGGNPISRVKPSGVTQRDPCLERNRLSAKYSVAKVQAMYPGAIPTLPKSFAAALTRGISAVVPEERLVDFAVLS